MSNNEECQICYQISDKSEICLKCLNSGCSKCIEKWFFNNKTCPFCRGLKTFNINNNPEKYIKELVRILNIGYKNLNNIDKIALKIESLFNSSNFDYLSKIFKLCCQIINAIDCFNGHTNYNITVFFRDIIDKGFLSTNDHLVAAIISSIMDEQSPLMYQNISSENIVYNILPNIVLLNDYDKLELLFKSKSGLRISNKMQTQLYLMILDDKLDNSFRCLIKNIQFPIYLLDDLFDEKLKEIIPNSIDMLLEMSFNVKECNYILKMFCVNIFPPTYIEKILIYIKNKNWKINQNIFNEINKTFKRSQKRLKMNSDMTERLSQTQENMVNLIKRFL